jgi:hypothetical protein
MRTQVEEHRNQLQDTGTEFQKLLEEYTQILQELQTFDDLLQKRSNFLIELINNITGMYEQNNNELNNIVNYINQSCDIDNLGRSLTNDTGERLNIIERQIAATEQKEQLQKERLQREQLRRELLPQELQELKTKIRSNIDNIVQYNNKIHRLQRELRIVLERIDNHANIQVVIDGLVIRTENIERYINDLNEQFQEDIFVLLDNELLNLKYIWNILNNILQTIRVVEDIEIRANVFPFPPELTIDAVRDIMQQLYNIIIDYQNAQELNAFDRLIIEQCKRANAMYIVEQEQLKHQALTAITTIQTTIERKVISGIIGDIQQVNRLAEVLIMNPETREYGNNLLEILKLVAEIFEANNQQPLQNVIMIINDVISISTNILNDYNIDGQGSEIQKQLNKLRNLFHQITQNRLTGNFGTIFMIGDATVLAEQIVTDHVQDVRTAAQDQAGIITGELLQWLTQFIMALNTRQPFFAPMLI